MFGKGVAEVEFAFIYPYSYEQCRKDIEQLKVKYEMDRELFFGHY
jgi:hypothetical protein